MEVPVGSLQLNSFKLKQPALFALHLSSQEFLTGSSRHPDEGWRHFRVNGLMGSNEQSVSPDMDKESVSSVSQCRSI